MEIVGNFTVPDDGEIQISMTYMGRGTQVRVLQGLEFMCWNVGEGKVEISARLITTREVPVGPQTLIHFNQRPGPHFLVSSPSEGQLYIAQK